MKRYLVFIGDVYYPSAGFGDFHGDYNNFEQARKEAEKAGNTQWCSIVDTVNRAEMWPGVDHDWEPL